MALTRTRTRTHAYTPREPSTPSRHSRWSTTEGHCRCGGLRLCACSRVRRPLGAPDPAARKFTHQGTQRPLLTYQPAAASCGPKALWGPAPSGQVRPGTPSSWVPHPSLEGLSPIDPPFTTLCSPSDPSKKEGWSLGWRERPASQSGLCLYLRPVGDDRGKGSSLFCTPSRIVDSG